MYKNKGTKITLGSGKEINEAKRNIAQINSFNFESDHQEKLAMDVTAQLEMNS